MVRNILGVIAGAVAAFVTIWLTDMLGHTFYPLPSDLNIRNSEDVATLLQTMPLGALLFVVAAWFLGALVGGVVAARIVRARWAAWTIAGLVAAAAILNVLMIPHPEWMQIAAVAMPLLGGLFASHTAPKRAVVVGEDREAADAAL